MAMMKKISRNWKTQIFCFSNNQFFSFFLFRLPYKPYSCRCKWETNSFTPFVCNNIQWEVLSNLFLILYRYTFQFTTFPLPLTFSIKHKTHLILTENQISSNIFQHATCKNIKLNYICTKIWNEYFHIIMARKIKKYSSLLGNSW